MSTIAGGGVDLEALTLTQHPHGSRADGTTLLEAVAWHSGELHTDSPLCVSPVLATLTRGWAAALDHDVRQQLKPFIPRLAGTAGDGRDRERALKLADWLARTAAPAMLGVADLQATAHVLAERQPICGWQEALELRPAAVTAEQTTRVRLEAAWLAPRAPLQAQQAADWARATGGISATAAACQQGLVPDVSLLDALTQALGALTGNDTTMRQAALGRVCTVAAAEVAQLATDAAAAAALTAALRAPADSAWATLRPAVRHLQDSMFVLLGRLCEREESHG